MSFTTYRSALDTDDTIPRSRLFVKRFFEAYGPSLCFVMTEKFIVIRSVLHSAYRKGLVLTVPLWHKLVTGDYARSRARVEL